MLSLHKLVKIDSWFEIGFIYCLLTIVYIILEPLNLTTYVDDLTIIIILNIKSIS